MRQSLLPPGSLNMQVQPGVVGQLVWFFGWFGCSDCGVCKHDLASADTRLFSLSMPGNIPGFSVGIPGYVLG